MRMEFSQVLKKHSFPREHGGKVSSSVVLHLQPLYSEWTTAPEISAELEIRSSRVKQQFQWELKMFLLLAEANCKHPKVGTCCLQIYPLALETWMLTVMSVSKAYCGWNLDPLATYPSVNPGDFLTLKLWTHQLFQALISSCPKNGVFHVNTSQGLSPC